MSIDRDKLPPELRQAFEEADRVEQAAQPPAGAPRPSLPATPAAPKPGALSDYERAIAYLKKVPGAGEGSRNSALNYVAFHLLEKFVLSESEHRELCLAWATMCSPPMEDREAKDTIASGWRGAHRANAVGSKRTEPIVPRAAGGGGRVEEKGARGEKSSTQEAPAPEGETPEERQAWLDKELPELCDAAKKEDGSARDQAVERLLDGLAKRWAFLSAVAQDRIKEDLCSNHKLIGKRGFNKAMQEAYRRKIKADGVGGEGHDSDWMGLALAYLTEGDGRHIRRWRQDWYQWSRATHCYVKLEDDVMCARVNGWMADRGVAVTVTSTKNFLNALNTPCVITMDTRPPTWLGEER